VLPSASTHVPVEQIPDHFQQGYRHPFEKAVQFIELKCATNETIDSQVVSVIGQHFFL
jgi:hypothetical protein